MIVIHSSGFLSFGNSFLLKHALFLHHLNHCRCRNALVNLGQKACTEDSHFLMHGADLGADNSDEVVCSLIADHLLTRVLYEVNAALDHQL